MGIYLCKVPKNAYPLLGFGFPKGGGVMKIFFQSLFILFTMNIDSVISTLQPLLARGLRPIVNSGSGLPSWLKLGSTHIAKIVKVEVIETRTPGYVMTKCLLEIDGKTVSSNLPLITLAAATYDRSIQIEVGEYTVKGTNRQSRVLNVTGIANAAGVIQPAGEVATPAVMASVFKMTPEAYESMLSTPAPTAQANPVITPAGVMPV